MPVPSPSLLAPLYNLDDYRRYFTDADYWAPFISSVASQRGYYYSSPPRSGLPGTFPTFILSDRWVIKFFGPLFDGLACYQTELAVSQLVHPPEFPVPVLLASGSLFTGDEAPFPWPYLIYEYIPSPSLGEVYDQVSFPSRLALACQLGELLSRMHALPIPALSSLSSTWDAYLALLTRLSTDCQARHVAWGSLPPALLAEIPSYLLPPSSLLPPAASPSLLHVDLTRDHLLGDLHSNDWHLRAIIDFGDALTGDLLYELVVLHLEIFDADPSLLCAFIDAYHPSPFHRQDFVRKAMTLTLLHPYDAFATLFSRHPDLRLSPTLASLALRIWSLPPLP
jgi:hygromycin-B 7''-O-kinase